MASTLLGCGIDGGDRPATSESAADLTGTPSFDIGRAARITTSQTMALFARTISGNVDWTLQSSPGGAFGGWSLLDSTTSAPVVERNTDGHLELFVEQGGTLFHRWTLGNTLNWSDDATLGSPPVVVISTPPAVVRNSDGRLEAFVAGSDGSVWHVWQASFNGPWVTSWAALGGAISTTPVAIPQADGTLTVFGRGSGGDLQQVRQAALDGPWGSWASLGGSLDNSHNPVAVASNANGRLVVFAVLSTGQLAYRTETAPGVWGVWTQIGVQVRGTPTIGMNLDGRLEVFAVDNSGRLGHAVQAGANGAWGSWQSFNVATISQSPDIGMNQDGSMELFFVVSGNTFHSMQQAGPGGAWGAPVALPALVVVAE